MKKQTFLSLFLVLFFQVCLHAQDCDCMRKYKKGTRYLYNQYDKNGKHINVAKDGDYAEVMDKIVTSDGWELQMGISVKDKNGNIVKTQTMKTHCTKGIYFFDLRESIGNATQNANANSNVKVSIKITGDPLIIINKDLEVGKEFPEATTEFATMLNDLVLTRSKVRTYNRKIVNIENVTTPLGSFDCYKITADMDMTFKLLRTRTTTTSSVMYWNKDYGMVKSVQYNDKGKEESSYVLAKFIE